MEPNTTPREIEKQLRAVRARIRRVQTLRAFGITGAVALGGLMAIMAADFFLAPLPVAGRWALSLGWLAATAVAAKVGFTPLFRPIGLVKIARWLEGRHPEIEERLSTVLELSREGSAISPGFLEALAAAAEKDIGGVDPRQEIRAARSRKSWETGALALLGILLLALAALPGEMARLLARAVAPFSDIGNAGAGRFTVQPGNLEVLAGDPVEITIDYTGKAERIDFLMETAASETFSQSLERSGDGFRYRLDPARESFRYRVRSGRDVSDTFAATVWPLPELTDARVALEFPAYTRAAASESPLGSGIEALAGSTATLTGTTNTAVEAAWIELDGREITTGSVENSAAGGRIAISWLMEKSTAGEATLKLRHRLGRVVDARQFHLAVLEDQPPVVRIVIPSQREMRVRPDEVFPVRYEVAEDFAVAGVALEVDAKEVKSLDQDLPARIEGSTPRRFEGSIEVAVGSLRELFPRAKQIRVRIKATDTRPADLEGPGVGYSEWIELKIDAGAESLVRRDFRDQHESAREKIEEALRDTRQARDRMDWHRDPIEKGQLEKNARKQFEEAAEKLARADETLRELADDMRESVHAAKAEDVAKAAGDLQQSRENLENTPLQDSTDERKETLAEAREDASKAIERLEKIREKLDEDRQRVEDLARVHELANQQRELAREAAETEEPPAQDWQERQKQMEEALRQQLRERPDARAEALAEQAEQARELSAQAEAVAEDQRELQQAAGSPETAEAAVREAISKAQQEIAAEAKSAAPEAAPAAGEAAEKFAAGDDPAAAEAARESGEAMEKAEPSAGKLAERQEAVAKAMEALAKGDPAAALDAMQEAAAEAAGELAAEVKAMPTAENSGAMQEAVSNANQGSEKAAQASQGEASQAAVRHEQAAGNFQSAAKALARAAEEFSQAASQAAAAAPNRSNAPVPAEAMASAFQQASQAAAGNEPAAASAAAAQSLAQAAQAGLQQMQGNQPGKPGTPGNPTMPGEESESPDRPEQAAPGLPPELAKLGISATDWEQIQSALNSDVGAGEADAIPAEYRALVKSYFESMSKSSSR